MRLLGERIMGQIVLVPFRSLRELRHTLDPALETARQLSAETVVLLRVDLPRCPETKDVEGERLFSEMRALHTQMADNPMPIHLDVMPGPTEKAIMRYAEQNDVGIVYTQHLRRVFNSPAKRPTA